MLRRLWEEQAEGHQPCFGELHRSEERGRAEMPKQQKESMTGQMEENKTAKDPEAKCLVSEP